MDAGGEHGETEYMLESGDSETYLGDGAAVEPVAGNGGNPASGGDTGNGGSGLDLGRISRRSGETLRMEMALASNVGLSNESCRASIVDASGDELYASSGTRFKCPVLSDGFRITELRRESGSSSSSKSSIMRLPRFARLPLASED